MEHTSEKNLTAPNRTFRVLPICFSRWLEFGPKLHIWLWRKKPNGAVNAGGLPTKMEQFVWCHFFRKGEIVVHIQMCDAHGFVTHTVALFKCLCVKPFVFESLCVITGLYFVCVKVSAGGQPLWCNNMFINKMIRDEWWVNVENEVVASSKWHLLIAMEKTIQNL